jgi:hypothetical protein
MRQQRGGEYGLRKQTGSVASFHLGNFPLCSSFKDEVEEQQGSRKAGRMKKRTAREKTTKERTPPSEEQGSREGATDLESSGFPSAAEWAQLQTNWHYQQRFAQHRDVEALFAFIATVGEKALREHWVQEAIASWRRLLDWERLQKWTEATKEGHRIVIDDAYRQKVQRAARYCLKRVGEALATMGAGGLGEQHTGQAQASSPDAAEISGGEEERVELSHPHKHGRTPPSLRLIAKKGSPRGKGRRES